jgi:hypothetical protein
VANKIDILSDRARPKGWSSREERTVLEFWKISAATGEG